MIIDTHQHLWDIDRFTYSWCQDVEVLNRSFLPNDYSAAIQNIGTQKSVFIEADVDEGFMLDETRWVLSLAENETTRIEGVVACCRPESSNFRGFLKALGSHPKLKGVRRILHNQPDELIDASIFSENIRALPQFGLSFDLCVLASQLPHAIRLVRACPETQFILDHCGNPDVKNQRLEPWREHLKQIAQHPNVDCKISGLVTNADHDNWTANDLRPYVEHAMECFGPERVMWGSDWPVCTLASGFRNWLDTAHEITQGESEENRRKLFYENANRVYKL